MAFPLLDLPVEIRFVVYRLVLVHPIRIVIRRKNRCITLRSGRAPRPRRPILYPDYRDYRTEGFWNVALLFTCSQVYHEAVPIYYRNNTFFAEDGRIFEEFFTTIGESRRKEIRTLICYKMFTSSLRLLPRLTGLRELTLSFCTITHLGDKFVYQTCEQIKTLEVLTVVPRFYESEPTALEASVNRLLAARGHTMAADRAAQNYLDWFQSTHR